MAVAPHLSEAVGFTFEGKELMDLAEKLHDAYASARPFPHVVIDDFLPESVIDALLGEFPSPEDGVQWQHLDHDLERKLALADDGRMGPATRHLLSQFNSSTFVTFLEAMTGINGLIPDPHYVGGGLHQIEPGGFLGVHADFNVHKRLRLDRRLNVLLYLNRSWQEEYGGHLQLWDRQVRQCERKILPVAGRCVVFSTTDQSFHGHPEPLKCPPDMTRKSLALYYYSNGRPSHETRPSHSTLFRSNPDGLRRLSDARDLAKQVVPPVMVKGARSMRDFVLEYRHRRAGRGGENGN